MPTIDVLLAGMTVNTDQSRLGLCTVTLIRGRTNILVDVAHFGRRLLLHEALANRGLTPDDIHTVVITHAHWDHAQNVDMFPKARYLINRQEVEYSRSPGKGDHATPPYFEATLKGLRVEDARDGMEIEPGVRIIETPGHTKGHVSVVVDTPQGKAVIAADAFPDAFTVKRGQPYLIFWNEQDARASVRKIMANGTMIYPGHDRPFRIGEGGATQYVGGVASIKVIARLEEGESRVVVNVGVE
ncbi:MAG: MBL fold metallo-hydrolase [Chloroflexi bacterium]|nr:MBL fold metallo-hydrolase [Chloroflexota bacterium]